MNQLIEAVSDPVYQFHCQQIKKLFTELGEAISKKFQNHFENSEKNHNTTPIKLSKNLG